MNAAELLMLAAMLAPGAEHAPGAQDVASAIAHAVASAPTHVFDDDDDGIRPGDVDAAVMLVYAWRESGFRVDAVGDGGKALGVWQLWYTPGWIALDVARAARAWHDLARMGARRWPECPLRGLSGGGAAGMRVAATRVQLARQLLRRLRMSTAATMPAPAAESETVRP